MRWDPYVLTREDQFDAFWAEHLKSRQRNVLFVVGRGFDIRATDGCGRILEAGGDGDRDLWILCFQNDIPEPEERKVLTDANLARFRSLFERGTIEDIPIELSGATATGITSRNVKRALSDSEKLGAYDDIVVDISAMPRMIAMTAIAQLTTILDDIERETKRVLNLHVTVAESVAVDQSPKGGSRSDSVVSVAGFSGKLTAEADVQTPRVWFPVLGEAEDDRLEKIWDKLLPDEICPVIPFPSRGARRGDEIIAGYRKLLFENFQVEPRNILNACEFNPFEAYKQLYLAIDRYRDALRGLGGCKAYVSPLSSKLLSVGALLACYDHRGRRRGAGEAELHVGIPYVESVSYGSPNQEPDDERELYSMWIRGEWEH